MPTGQVMSEVPHLCGLRQLLCATYKEKLLTQSLDGSLIAITTITVTRRGHTKHDIQGPRMHA